MAFWPSISSTSRFSARDCYEKGQSLVKVKRKTMLVLRVFLSLLEIKAINNLVQCSLTKRTFKYCAFLLISFLLMNETTLKFVVITQNPIVL